MKKTIHIVKFLYPSRLLLISALMTAVFFAGCQSALPPKPYIAPRDAAGESGRPFVFMTATEMAAAIRNNEITSSELVRAHLNHIYLYNPSLNAIVILEENTAMKQAAEADRALARGEIWGPLHGVPITIKDHFAVKNMLTTNAHPEMAEQITLFDATVVKRMKDAGAIILGKTNMPYLGMDWQTNNEIFGRTNNPWDLDRTPGGSGGGGAAAVASGMSPLDIGSDIGGSLRIPTHFTGTYGFKPTENTVSNYGSYPGIANPDRRSIRNMSSIGPIARSMEDLQLAFEIISGPDEIDALVIPLVRPAHDEEKTVDSLRIAWSNKFGDVPITEETRIIMNDFLQKLENAGSTVARLDPDIPFNDVWKTWGELIDVQIMADQPGHARFYTFMLGWSYRAQTPLLQQVSPVSTEMYVHILSRRDQIISTFDRFMADWDVFICPVVSMAAIEHFPPDAIRSNMPIYTSQLMVSGQYVNYHTAMGSYATPFNLTGNPVVTIPVGYTPDGLPIGLQIVGKRWEDFKLLEDAALINEIAGAYREPAGY
jgi:amidase